MVKIVIIVVKFILGNEVVGNYFLTTFLYEGGHNDIYKYFTWKIFL